MSFKAATVLIFFISASIISTTSTDIIVTLNNLCDHMITLRVSSYYRIPSPFVGGLQLNSSASETITFNDTYWIGAFYEEEVLSSGAIIQVHDIFTDRNGYGVQLTNDFKYGIEVVPPEGCPPIKCLTPCSLETSACTINGTYVVNYCPSASSAFLS